MLIFSHKCLEKSNLNEHSKYIEIPRKLYSKIETESRILEDGSFKSSFNVNVQILLILNIKIPKNHKEM